MPWARVHELEAELFRANASFVAIDPIEDIESLLKFGTQDNLMIGTVYSRDISANPSALDEGRIRNAQARKILRSNSQACYRPVEKDVLPAAADIKNQ